MLTVIVILAAWMVFFGLEFEGCLAEGQMSPPGAVRSRLSGLAFRFEGHRGFLATDARSVFLFLRMPVWRHAW